MYNSKYAKIALGIAAMLSVAQTNHPDKWDEDERKEQSLSGKRYLIEERIRIKAEAQRKSRKGKRKKGKKSK